jgi:Na+-transporting NADH:ubiquinone oxidoreductase subunit NqrF
VNLPGLYSTSNSKSLITVRDSKNITLVNNWKDISGYNASKEMREVNLMMDKGTTVTIQSNTFDQIVITAVFRGITDLQLSEKSFLSCWGSVWLFNVVVLKNSSHSNPFSSSDLVVHNGVFTVNERPKVTPRLKFSQIYEVSAKVYDLGISLETIIFIQTNFLI